MSERPSASISPAERLAPYRSQLAAMRAQARDRYQAGTGGIHLLAGMSEATDALVVALFEASLAECPAEVRRAIAEQTAIVAVGGSGRGEMAPYSDVDLLFLHRRAVQQPFAECVARVVRDCWDVGLKLGHSVRTVDDTLAMARHEPQFATAVIEARRVWGDERLVELLRKQFRRKLIRGRVATFIDTCVAARAGEFQEHGGTVQQLEPDIKRSAGGLRDLHLIRWVGFARHGTTDISLLRLEGALTSEDAQALLAAQEFLSRLRVGLHLAAGKPQDVLTREEQLRVAGELQTPATAGQSGVERFMQQYFRHTTAISQIARRFVALQRPQSFATRAAQFVMRHRADRIFRVGRDEIDVVPSKREEVCGNLERLLQLYEMASLYGATPAPLLSEAIKQHAAELSDVLPPGAPGLFLSILKHSQRLGPILRSMYDTGVLEKVLPDFAHVRCLLQFNQYHSYTVDEHTLRAIEAVTALQHDAGPVGQAYREVHHKDILHLAVLLHDIGKGFVEDHSNVGRDIAERLALRLGLPSHLREMLVVLVHKHLRMADLAFRRNISDPEVIIPFSREVGSPEILRMLYALTVADISAVGPGAWTDWKGELLAALYDRAMLELSGEPSHFRELALVERARQQVLACLKAGGESAVTPEQAQATLDTLPTNYLTATPPEQIASAVRCIPVLGPDEVVVQSAYDPHMKTIEHRVIARDHIGSGCFSKITGVLTAKRLEILSAQINTSSQGIVLDSFRVLDFDFAGPVPDSRLREIEQAIKDVLIGSRTVEQLFRSHRRFDIGGHGAVSDLPTRVVIDNDSSDRFTIIDVFAHDRTGLLYTIANTILELNLSVGLAKIATHLDQVVDVFYVSDREGRKIHDVGRLDTIRETLEQRIEAFERQGLAPVVA